MFLKKIYSLPEGLFKEVEFKDGINFIFGKKDNPKEPKKSLNSIGKSTFLDLIDFCLLASYQKNHSPRLYKAREIIAEHLIILEFEIDDIDYVIRRGILKPNEVEFGYLDDYIKTGDLPKYQIIDLRAKLCDLIFKRNDYAGYFSNKWYRNLVSFYLKIQKQKKEAFTDPISYIKEISESELNQYHLFLMDIDNEISHKNFEILIELKRIVPAIDEIKRFIEESYDINDISDINKQISDLSREIKKLQEAIELFKLHENYKDAEKEANEYTENIKELILLNYQDNEKLRQYAESYSITDKVSPIKVANIYKELNEDLGAKIKKTLEEAISFRKELSNSRKDFLVKEVKSLNTAIEKRLETLNTIEEARGKLFKFLSNKEAISDLTDAFYKLSEKRQSLNELTGQMTIYNKLSIERVERETEQKNIEKQSLEFTNEIKPQITVLSDLFFEIYSAIYQGESESSFFDISTNLSLDSKIDINITIPEDLGKGKNRGRTLIYDLMVLFNGISQNIKMPRFLIHDGIFDGMDKAHFIALYEYLIKQLSNKQRFQYIITVNEEGTLDNDFGNADIVTPDRIASEAILVLTPTSKLFGKPF